MSNPRLSLDSTLTASSWSSLKPLHHPELGQESKSSSPSQPKTSKSLLDRLRNKNGRSKSLEGEDGKKEQEVRKVKSGPPVEAGSNMKMMRCYLG